MRHSRLNFFVVVAVAVAVIACFAGVSFAAPKVEVIRVPDGGLHPQAQVDAAGTLHVIYFKGDPLHGDVFYVRSRDDGARFSSPIRVNSQSGSAVIIGTIRGPQLAIGKGGRVHVAWMGSDTADPKVRGKQAPMLYARLTDAGDRFEEQRNVIHDHPGLDGGGSVAADNEGNVYVAWHAGDGEGEQNRRVWITRSCDDGATFEPEHAAISDSVGACGCCGMRVFAAENGRVFIAFRSATQRVHRDVHLLMSDDHGQSFKIATVDPWQVGTCVMSTAAFAARDEQVVAAWETENQIRFARLTGATFTATITAPGDAARRKHPAVAINPDGDTLVAWAEVIGWNQPGGVGWLVLDRQGRTLPGAAGRAAGLAAWSVPAVFAARDGNFRLLY